MSVTNKRKCCHCKRFLTKENQYSNSRGWYVCKRCAANYFKSFAATRRKTLFQRIMKNLKVNGCAICGYNECNEALDFHHVNPWRKKFKINMTNLYHSNLDMETELNKCMLLCKNCHTEIHAKERDVPLKRQGYIKELQTDGTNLELFMAEREECSKKQARRH